MHEQSPAVLEQSAQHHIIRELTLRHPVTALRLALHTKEAAPIIATAVGFESRLLIPTTFGAYIYEYVKDQDTTTLRFCTDSILASNPSRVERTSFQIAWQDDTFLENGPVKVCSVVENPYTEQERVIGFTDNPYLDIPPLEELRIRLDDIYTGKADY